MVLIPHHRWLLACLCACAAFGCKHTSSGMTDLHVTITGTVDSFDADEHGMAWLATSGEQTVLSERDDDGRVVEIARGTLFAVALAGDKICWSDSDHVSCAPRGTPAATQLASTDDSPMSLVVSGGYVYWLSKRAIWRVAVGGGTAEQVSDAPPDPASDHGALGGSFQRLAVEGSQVVAVYMRPTGPGTARQPFRAELWRLDARPVRLAAEPASTVLALRLDGDTAVWELMTSEHGHELLRQPLSGGPAMAVPDTLADGNLLDARGGAVAIALRGPKAGTYLVRSAVPASRLGVRAVDGKIVGARFVGVFPGKGTSERLGYLTIPQ